VNGKALKLYDSASADLNKLVDPNHNGSQAAGQKAEEALDQARTVMLGALALAIVSAWGLIHSITRPLTRTMAVAS
jgi:hypothetical protein